MDKALAKLLLNKLLKLSEDLGLEQVDHYKELDRIFKFCIEQLIEKEGIHFSTMFSKVAFLGNKYAINKSLLYHLHGFRRASEDSFSDQSSSNKRKSYTKAIAQFIIRVAEIEDNTVWESILATSLAAHKKDQVKRYIPQAEILVLDIDLEHHLIKGYTSVTPHEKVTARFNITHKNEIYTKSIRSIYLLNGLPINFYLHEIEVDDEGYFIPSIIVLEPSYLIDVTAVAEAFKQDASMTRISLLRRFLPSTNSMPLLVGNISNHMLDELVANPALEFSEIKKQLFQLHPLVFALYDDAKIMDLISDLKLHYSNLKKVINTDFESQGIRHSNAYLEPAFYSPSYGIQGRLDLLRHDESSSKATIIELKSGKAFRANVYGLSEKHYVQTLLYDLLLKSALDKKTRVDSYILYSKESDQSLRYAPAIKLKQKEAISIRNEIIIYNKSLEQLDNDAIHNILDYIKVDKFKKISGFEKRDVEHFEKNYGKLDPVEKSYFNHFTAFIAREQRLSKIGQQQINYINGLSGIWENTIDQKKENFNILNDLEIASNLTDEIVPQLMFNKSKLTMKLSNFRVGDIGVLYPELGVAQSALHTQVFKCTVLENNDKQVVVRLRSQQKNYSIFRKYKYWHIDHDTLDTGYTKMTRSLFEFSSSVKRKMDLWLTRVSPAKTADNKYQLSNEMTVEQKQIMGEILDSEDYYLLWGPPGTGKTSVMVKNLVSHLYSNSQENLLLLAYTNKAVDEICEALLAIDAAFVDRFIRVGSRYSVNSKFVGNLLDESIRNVSTRKELRAILSSKRIYVGTISSMLGKTELFDLLKFDRVIIDEASQLLEPTIIGFLTRFDKVVLIGDHKQLPAVVRQSKEDAAIKDSALNKLGLTNMSNSLFERLYLRCLTEGWDWAIGQLTHQGRMHQDIMDFPNQQFYQDDLKTIDKIARLTLPLSLSHDEATKVLATQRTIYINAEVDDHDLQIKTNHDEAEKVAKLVKDLQMLFERNGCLQDRSIGVITPFRAQIANIQSRLRDHEIDESLVVIDTVERFQGGAKDVIIISFCMNQVSQLNRMISLSSEGIDRKLNVALTRAKEQLILVGNEKILSVNPVYRELIASCYRLAY